jgi:hypothetical protein
MAAETTVDAKPMAKLPYDPKDIPEAVRKRAAAVDALYAQSGSQQSSPIEPVPQTAPGSEPTTPEPSAAQQAPASSAPAESASLPAQAPPATAAAAAELLAQRAEPSRPKSPPEDENSETWKSRYERMKGQWTAAQRTVGEMQEQMAQLGNELLQLQRAPPPQQLRQPPPPPPTYLTEQDEQNYGRDLIDFTTRAAAQALTPHLQQIEQQNAELQRRLAIEARNNLDARVEAAVPNFREIDRDPLWHRWLLGVDVLSGRVRQQLLNEAIATASAPRVISFFRGFQQEAIATGHAEPASRPLQAEAPRTAAIDLASIAAPGRARPATGGEASLPADKPVYTRAQIAALYSAHRKGAYVGREAEWARQDADIIAAGREGRIR